MTYTKINNEILNTPLAKGGLDGYEILVYLYALKSQNNPNFMFSAERITKHYGLGKLVITRAIKSLEAKGMLEREYYNDEKGYRRAFYRVSENLHPADDEFVDEDMLILSKDAPAPNSNTLKAPAEIKQEVEQTIQQERQEKPKNTAEHIGQKVKSYDEIMQEQIAEKADFIYRNFNANDELSFETWLDWAKYKQSINKLDIVALELVLKQSINALNGFKDRANEAIEYSIAGGYKQLFLPKIDETKQEQKSEQSSENDPFTRYANEEAKKAGVDIPIKFHLFKKSELYTGLDYEKHFWSIIYCNNPKQLIKFDTSEGRIEIEVREHLNEIAKLRYEFLKKKNE